MDNPFRKGPQAGGSFLPESYVANKAQARTNALGLFLFVVVLVGVVGAFMVTNQRWESVRHEQAAINSLYEEEAAKIDQLKALEAQRQELVAKAEVTTALVDRVPRSVLLAEIVTRMPEPITILEFELESTRVKPTAPAKDSGKGAPAVKTISSKSGSKKPAAKPEPPKPQPPRFQTSLSIIGVASANNDIADFLAGLKACTLLASVEIEYIRETRMDELDLRKFRIKAAVAEKADAADLESVEETTLVNWTPSSAPLQETAP